MIWYALSNGVVQQCSLVGHGSFFCGKKDGGVVAQKEFLLYYGSTWLQAAELLAIKAEV